MSEAKKRSLYYEVGQDEMTMAAQAGDIRQEMNEFFKDKHLLIFGEFQDGRDGKWSVRDESGDYLQRILYAPTIKGVDVWDENGRMFIEVDCSEGKLTDEVRVLTDEGYEYFDNWLSSPKLLRKEVDIGEQMLEKLLSDQYSELPRMAEKTFGAPAEEWVEKADKIPGTDVEWSRFWENEQAEIAVGLEQGVDVSVYAVLDANGDPVFNIKQMEQMRWGMRDGLDVSIYADPKYDHAQMSQMRQGLVLGLDVSVYANPNLPSYRMEATREGMMIEQRRLEAERAEPISQEEYTQAREVAKAIEGTGKPTRDEILSVAEQIRENPFPLQEKIWGMVDFGDTAFITERAMEFAKGEKEKVKPPEEEKVRLSEVASGARQASGDLAQDTQSAPVPGQER